MKRSRCIFSNLVIILLALITLSVIGFMVAGSFQSEAEVLQNYGGIYTGNGKGEYARLDLIPDELSLMQYYKVLLASPEFLFRFFNSILISGLILAGVLVAGILGGYGFAKFCFPFRNALLFLFILFMMMPYQVTLVPNFIMLNSLGWIDSRLSLIVPNIFTPFGVFLIVQFIKKIPDETMEAARLEGAGEIRVLTRVVIPQAVPGIVSLTILNLIDTWSMIEQPLVFLKDEKKYPLSLALSLINQSDIGIAFVCGVIFLVPLILVFLIGKDYLTDGLSNSVF